MSKFLKTIDIIIFILALLAAAALLVPPLLGVNAIVVGENTSSNEKVGSVVYTQTVESDSISAGNQIVVVSDNEVNLYNVSSYDEDQHIATAALDNTDGAEDEMIDVGTYVNKGVLVVPFLGYLKIATESMTGLMILGGCVLVWILLMILSIVLRKDYDDEDEDEDEEEYFRTLTQPSGEEDGSEASASKINIQVEGDGEEFISNLKGAVSGRETESYLKVTPEISAENEEAEEKEAEEKDGQPEDVEDETKDADGSARPEEDEELTGDEGSIDEGVSLDELENIFEKDTEEEQPVKKESRGVPEEKDMGTGELPDVQAALEAALENQQISYSRQKKNTPEAAEEEEVTIATGAIELAIPSYSVEELLEKARKEGFEPKVKETRNSDIKLVDFSDII